MSPEEQTSTMHSLVQAITVEQESPMVNSSENIEVKHRTIGENNNESVSTYDLLYIIRAYNRKEISFEEWIKRSREWAEGIIKQYGKTD